MVVNPRPGRVKNPGADRRARSPLLSKKQLLPPMAHRPPHPLQNIVHRIQIKFFGMERFTSPTTESIIIRHSPILAFLFPLVKVAVCPAEDGLEGVVETASGKYARHLDSSPNGRFDFEEGNLEVRRWTAWVWRWA